jgi:hypothetical protein
MHRKNSMIKHRSNWEAILRMSFFQQQKSTDRPSIFGVFKLCTILYKSNRVLETCNWASLKEEANACYFNTCFNYYCTESGYWLTLHRAFSDCCCWQRYIGIVHKTKWNPDLRVQFCIISLLRPPWRRRAEGWNPLVSYMHHHPLWILKTVIIHLSCLGRLDSAAHESTTGIMSFTLP